MSEGTASPPHAASATHTLACHAIGYGIGHGTDRLPILQAIDLSVSSGEVVSLLGVNGAGKSTLLRIMLGLLKPTQGEVRLNGRPIDSYRRRDVARHLAYVPQQHVPTFPYTVRQIVALGRLPHAGLNGTLRDPDRAAIDTALRRMDVAGLAERPYTALSGGERQRVLLARALAQQAAILVLDEPLNGLDYGHQMRLLTLLSSLAREGYAVLSTTHHPEQALLGSTRAVLLERGRLIADGPPRHVLDAASMSDLYDIALEQIDTDSHRFFIPRR